MPSSASMARSCGRVPTSRRHEAARGHRARARRRAASAGLRFAEQDHLGPPPACLQVRSRHRGRRRRCCRCPATMRITARMRLPAPAPKRAVRHRRAASGMRRQRLACRRSRCAAWATSSTAAGRGSGDHDGASAAERISAAAQPQVPSGIGVASFHRRERKRRAAGQRPAARAMPRLSQSLPPARADDRRPSGSMGARPSSAAPGSAAGAGEPVVEHLCRAFRGRGIELRPACRRASALPATRTRWPMRLMATL